MPGMPSLPGMDDLPGHGDGQELFMKNGRIAMPSPDGTRFVVHCAIGEFAMVADRHDSFWQGTPAQFLEELEAAFAMMGMSDPDEPGWIEHMFGSGRDAVTVPVRTTRVGEETVAGYDAVQYSIEFERDGRWESFGNVSAAPGLLREIEAEIGPCFNTVLLEMQQALVAMGLGEADEMWSVLTSPEYTALANEGYPVRNEQIVETFGMRIESTTEVTQVNRGPLADDMFVIPDQYERISLLEAMMPRP